MADEITPTPAEGDETPTAPVEGQTPPEATAEAAPAEPEHYTLPEGHEAWDEAQLREQFDAIEAEVQDLLPNITLLAEMTPVNERREAQRAIAALIQQRHDEAAQLAQELEAAGEVVELPDPSPALPRAASVASDIADALASGNVETPANTAAAIVPARVEESPVARVAAVVANWRDSRDGEGGTVAFGSLFDEHRPEARGVSSDGVMRLEDSDVRRSTILATVRIERDAELELTDSTAHNEAAIAEVTRRHREARRAATTDPNAVRMAAICDPASILRDATTCGSTQTPFQNSLPSMNAASGNKLKFQYRASTTLSAAAGGVGVWDATKQAAVSASDSATWKPCVAIACPTYTTVQASEITACYSVDAFTELSSPEAEADFVQAKDRAWGRVSEGWFLREVDKYLIPLTFAGHRGAVPDFISAVLTPHVWASYTERLDPEADGYVMYGDLGLLEALVIDENKKAYSNGVESLADVRSAIEGATGASYVQLLDKALATNDSVPASPFAALPAKGGTAAAMPDLTTITFVLRYLDPSAFVMWTTGEGIFGDQITLDQARQNKRGFFQRMFGGLMNPGCAPGFKISMTLCLEGARTGFVTPTCT